MHKSRFYLHYIFIKNNFLFILASVVLFSASYIISMIISPAPSQSHFTDLAYSFIHGRLDIIDPSRLFDDTAVFNGKTYIYYNPLPAVLLIPFVTIFGNAFLQEWLTPFITVTNFVLFYQIAKKNGVKSTESCFWLSIFFIFGTIYTFLAITTISSYYVQVVGLLFILLSLNEFFGTRRWWLIGLFVAAAGSTRATLFLSVIFYIIYIITLKNSMFTQFNKVLKLSIPIIIIIFILALYNFTRFNSWTETGYNHQINDNPIYTIPKSHGVFSLNHIPGNLYFLLFKGPDVIRQDDTSFMLRFPYLRVNEWGMSIFLTSPLFLYLINVKRSKYLLPSIGVIIAMLIPILTYFGVGVWQYGYRYALDFYPFLLLLLFPIFKERMDFLPKLLIAYSIIFNMLFMYSIWYLYPFPI